MTNTIETEKYIRPLDALILISIALQTVWGATQGFIFKFDEMGRGPVSLLCISFAAALIFHTQYLKKIKFVMLVWGGWVLYTIINTVCQGWTNTGTTSKELILLYLVAHWFYFSLIAVMLQKFNNLTTKVLIVSLLAICVLYNLFGQWVNTRGNFTRFYTEVINANEFAYVTLTLIALQIYDIVRNGLAWWKLPVLFYALLLLLDTGSRTAFIALMPLVFMPVWQTLRRKLSIGSTFCISLIVLVIMLPAVLAVSEKTIARQRLQERQEELEILDLDDDIWVNRVLGERAVHYTEGIYIWQSAPFFGVGHCNYINHSQYKLRSHIEYMAQLSEGGIIGFGLYIWALMLLGYNIKSMKKTTSEKPMRMLTFSFFLTLLIFNMGLFTTNQNSFYILFAYLSLGLYRPLRPDELVSGEKMNDQIPVQEV